MSFEFVWSVEFFGAANMCSGERAQTLVRHLMEKPVTELRRSETKTKQGQGRTREEEKAEQTDVRIVKIGGERIELNKSDCFRDFT